jgi:hypothetical protein
MDDKGYAAPYESSGKKVVKVAAQYNLSRRSLDKWEYVEA